jgi:hypothetical protein
MSNYIHIWQDTDFIKKEISNLVSDKKKWEITYWNYEAGIEYLKLIGINKNICDELSNPNLRHITRYLILSNVMLNFDGIWISKNLILNKYLDDWIPPKIDLMIELHDTNGSHDINDNIIVSFNKNKQFWKTISDKILYKYEGLKTQELKNVKSIIRQSWVDWITQNKQLYYGYIMSVDVNEFRIFNNNDAYIMLNKNIESNTELDSKLTLNSELNLNFDSIYNYNVSKQFLPDQTNEMIPTETQNAKPKDEYDGIETNVIIGRYIDPDIRNSEKSRGKAKSVSKLGNIGFGDFKPSKAVFLKKPKRSAQQILNGKSPDSSF